MVLLDSTAGSIRIEENVIKMICAIAAKEVEGVHDLSGRLLEDVLRDPKKGVNMKDTTDALHVEVIAGIIYGFNVLEVAKNIQKHVAHTVHAQTGFTPVIVDVTVNGLFVSKENTTPGA